MKSICEISSSGNQYWYLNNKLHREDGPAYEGVDGTKEWWVNGLLHREDGPAVEYVDGYEEWYLHGKFIDCKDNQEFLRIVKLMIFL